MVFCFGDYLSWMLYLKEVYSWDRNLGSILAPTLNNSVEVKQVT